MRKGQSAMEYLMTYGWMILLIVVISGVLVYYGMFTPPVGQSISGFGSVMPLAAEYASDGSLKLYVENRAGGEINITSVVVESTPLSGLAPTAMAMAGRSWVKGTTATPGSPGDPYNLEVSVTYVKAGEPLTTTGTITGSRS